MAIRRQVWGAGPRLCRSTRLRATFGGLQLAMVVVSSQTQPVGVVSVVGGVGSARSRADASLRAGRCGKAPPALEVAVPASSFLAAGAQSHLLGKLGARRRVVRGNHRVIVRQIPLLPVL